MGAEDFKDRQGKRPHVEGVQQMLGAVEIAHGLRGKKWDDAALSCLMAFSPTKIRAITGEATTDSCRGRITVYLDDNDLITGVEQELGMVPQEHAEFARSVLGLQIPSRADLDARYDVFSVAFERNCFFGSTRVSATDLAFSVRSMIVSGLGGDSPSLREFPESLQVKTVDRNTRLPGGKL